MAKKTEHFASGTTYLAELNDEGLMNYPKENLLQITVGDTIVFHIKPGSPISKNAYLRINLPQISSDNLYHKTAAFMESLRKRPSSPKLTESAAEDEKDPGLACIEPTERAFGDLEFEVHFKYPGSFFYQIEYLDQNLNIRSNFVFPSPFMLTRPYRLHKTRLDCGPSAIRNSTWRDHS